MLKYFSIIIGSQGINVRLIKKDEIVFNEFFTSFEEEQKNIVKHIFLDNSHTKIYIFLVTIGQNYAIKKFPLQINLFEVKKLVNRKFDFEIPKTDLRTKISCGTNKATKEWEFLFVSSPIEEILKNVLSFIETLPNFLAGIFMIPLESINIIKDLSKHLKLVGKNKPKWILFLIENKASGIRQIAFRDEKLIFTRFLYNLNEQADRRSKILYFENDISRTIGFMKRFGSDFNNKDLLVIGATNNDTKNIFANSDLKMLKTHYFSSEEIATMMFKRIPNISNYQYMDKIFERYVVSKKSVFPFFTPDLKNIKTLLKLNHILQYVLIIFIGLFIYMASTILVKLAISLYKNSEVSRQIENINKQITKTNESSILKNKNVNKIIELGSLYLEVQKVNDDFYKSINNMSALTYNNTKINNIKYNLNGFDKKKIQNSKIKKNFEVNLTIKNPTQTAESIVELFNTYKTEVQPKLQENFKMKEMNIINLDFSKKYENYQFTINLEEK